MNNIERSSILCAMFSNDESKIRHFLGVSGVRDMHATPTFEDANTMLLVYDQMVVLQLIDTNIHREFLAEEASTTSRLPPRLAAR